MQVPVMLIRVIGTRLQSFPSFPFGSCPCPCQTLFTITFGIISYRNSSSISSCCCITFVLLILGLGLADSNTLKGF